MSDLEIYGPTGLVVLLFLFLTIYGVVKENKKKEQERQEKQETQEREKKERLEREEKERLEREEKEGSEKKKEKYLELIKNT